MDLTILQGDCREKLKELPDESVHCCVTSPPYFGLRDYGVDGQIGLEATPDAFVAQLVDVFREVRRVLRDDGTLWLNLGDSYAGSWGAMSYAKGDIAARRFGGDGEKIARPVTSRLSGDLKAKDLIGIPWMVAFALRADGWWLRQDIIWSKPNPMPESVTDRCTKAHEYIFLLSKSERYYYDQDAIKETAIGPAGGNIKPSKSFEHDPVKHRTKAGLALAQQRARENGGFERRNRRSVWNIANHPYSDAHFATYPPDLIKPCILAGCPARGVVLDPFAGSGTTGEVALKMGCSAILIELNPNYVPLIEKRCYAHRQSLFDGLSA